MDEDDAFLAQAASTAGGKMPTDADDDAFLAHAAATAGAPSVVPSSRSGSGRPVNGGFDAGLSGSVDAGLRDRALGLEAEPTPQMGADAGKAHGPGLGSAAVNLHPVMVAGGMLAPFFKAGRAIGRDITDPRFGPGMTGNLVGAATLPGRVLTDLVEGRPPEQQAARRLWNEARTTDPREIAGLLPPVQVMQGLETVRRSAQERGAGQGGAAGALPSLEAFTEGAGQIGMGALGVAAGARGAGAELPAGERIATGSGYRSPILERGLARAGQAISPRLESLGRRVVDSLSDSLHGPRPGPIAEGAYRVPGQASVGDLSPARPTQVTPGVAGITPESFRIGPGAGGAEISDASGMPPLPAARPDVLPAPPAAQPLARPVEAGPVGDVGAAATDTTPRPRYPPVLEQAPDPRAAGRQMTTGDGAWNAQPVSPDLTVASQHPDVLPPLPEPQAAVRPVADGVWDTTAGGSNVPPQISEPLPLPPEAQPLQRPIDASGVDEYSYPTSEGGVIRPSGEPAVTPQRPKLVGPGGEPLPSVNPIVEEVMARVEAKMRAARAAAPEAWDARQPRPNPQHKAPWVEPPPGMEPLPPQQPPRAAEGATGAEMEPDRGPAPIGPEAPPSRVAPPRAAEGATGAEMLPDAGGPAIGPEPTAPRVAEGAPRPELESDRSAPIVRPDAVRPAPAEPVYEGAPPAEQGAAAGPRKGAPPPVTGAKRDKAIPDLPPLSPTMEDLAHPGRNMGLRDVAVSRATAPDSWFGMTDAQAKQVGLDMKPGSGGSGIAPMLTVRQGRAAWLAKAIKERGVGDSGVTRGTPEAYAIAAVAEAKATPAQYALVRSNPKLNAVADRWIQLREEALSHPDVEVRGYQQDYVAHARDTRNPKSFIENLQELERPSGDREVTGDRRAQYLQVRRTGASKTPPDIVNAFEAYGRAIAYDMEVRPALKQVETFLDRKDANGRPLVDATDAEIVKTFVNDAFIGRQQITDTLAKRTPGIKHATALLNTGLQRIGLPTIDNPLKASIDLAKRAADWTLVRPAAAALSHALGDLWPKMAERGGAGILEYAEGIDQGMRKMGSAEWDEVEQLGVADRPTESTFNNPVLKGLDTAGKKIFGVANAVDRMSKLGTWHTKLGEYVKAGVPMEEAKQMAALYTQATNYSPSATQSIPAAAGRVGGTFYQFLKPGINGADGLRRWIVQGNNAALVRTTMGAAGLYMLGQATGTDILHRVHLLPTRASPAMFESKARLGAADFTDPFGIAPRKGHK